MHGDIGTVELSTRIRVRPNFQRTLQLLDFVLGLRVARDFFAD